MNGQRNPVPVKNPLLIEDVLDNIFSYFEDPANLCSFRLVNKIWNRSAVRAVKRSLTWKIQPGDERKFVQVFSKGGSAELLRNFQFGRGSQHYGSTDQRRQTKAGDVLGRFSLAIVDMKLRASDPSYVTKHLLSSCLPNVESLQLYDISPEILGHPDLLDGFYMKKLSRVSFLPHELQRRHNTLPLFISDHPKEAIPVMVFDILKGCGGQLQTLEFSLPNTIGKVLAHPDLKLASLTSLVTICGFDSFLIPTVVLGSRDIKNLMAKCPNLKVFCAHIYSDVPKVNLYRLMVHYAASIKKLDLRLTTRLSLFDESNDEDEGQNGGNKRVHHSSFPDLPLLTWLRLDRWDLHNNFNIFSGMTALQHLSLLLKECTLPIIPPPNGFPTVSYLNFATVKDTINEEDTQDTITALARIFPELIELKMKVNNDVGLRAIFKNMKQLKRLHLTNSFITDSGITGISKYDMEQAFVLKEMSMVNIASLRRFPSIADLKGLQHFTYKMNMLSNLTTHFGLAALKELTYLRLPPCKRFTGLTTPYKLRRSVSPLPRMTSTSCITEVEAVDVRALLRKCGNLLKLDVNDSTRQHLKRGEVYTGCGIIDQDIVYIKTKRPNLEIVYRENKTLSERIRESKM